ncbi:MAG: hypothetical protein J6K19_08750 [Prevotella sp.]|nr:hypothetical protein [Prevotella sp.]
MKRAVTSVFRDCTIVIVAVAMAVLIRYRCESYRDANDTSCCQEKNGIYYWKTVFEPDTADCMFLRKHDIGRVYLRMFDVSIDKDGGSDHAHTYPNATLTVPYGVFEQLKDSFPEMEYVPVVYITLDALKDGKKSGLGALARNIVTRVKNMCSYNSLYNVGCLQLDCDWTRTTEQAFFSLCDSVRMQIRNQNLPWKLSSTIRLHQLAGQAPPVDCGVLMVYNTGEFNNPDESNSILSEKYVRPYLNHIGRYPLPLDVAYPTYSWQLLFRKRRFVGLLNGVDVDNKEKFCRKTANTHIVLKDIPYRGTILRKGDVIRTEQSDYKTLGHVKRLIESSLGGKSHSSILYHFDLNNLLKYSDNEIEDLFKTTLSD